MLQLSQSLVNPDLRSDAELGALLKAAQQRARADREARQPHEEVWLLSSTLKARRLGGIEAWRAAIEAKGAVRTQVFWLFRPSNNEMRNYVPSTAMNRFSHLGNMDQ